MLILVKILELSKLLMPTDFCSTECNEGKFGLNCNLPCGHCLNNVVECHYIDGTCLNGCDSGYQGSNCKQSICNHLFKNICWNIVQI